MPSNTIAVNLASYQQFAEGAFAHLESIGVRHVEIAVPAPDAMEEPGAGSTVTACRQRR
jgi:hypothetical protein